MTGVHSLASDNYAAVHPEVMAALAAANEGHVPSYGADPVTERAIAAMRADLGADAEIGFVFNGTGANVVGLQLMLHPWQHVVCARTAHINVQETENVIFDGADAAVARINLDGAPGEACLAGIRQNADVLDVQLVSLSS